MQHQNKTISHREKKGRGGLFSFIKKKLNKNKTKQKRATTTTSIPGSQ